MTCYADEAVQLDTTPIEMPRRPGEGVAPGETETRHRGTASCGWGSKSLGTQVQALSWARQHAAKFHGDRMIQCPESRHDPHPRDGFCRRCGADTYTPDRRAKWLSRYWAEVPSDAVGV